MPRLPSPSLPRLPFGPDPLRRVRLPRNLASVTTSGDECPYIPGRRYIDWDLPDPKGQPIDAVRRTRDDIGRRVDGLARELDTRS